jgi:hypothetical protein
LSTAFSLLLVCIVLASGSAIHEVPAARSLIEVLAVAALALVGVGASGRAIDVNFVARCTRGLKIAAAIPAIWMVIQLLPLPVGAHSIWIYANEALGRQSWGHISVDLGRTVLALAFYLANLSLILVSVFVTRERRRAELLLFALTAIATLTTLGLLIGKFGLIPDLSKNNVLGGISALGILLSLASLARALEWYENDRRKPGARNAGPAFAVGAAGLIIGVIALIASATLNVALTVIFATLIFGSVEILRRMGLARWAAGVLLITIMIAAAMVIVWRYDSTRALSPFLQFATASSQDAISVTQRLLSDTSWLGAGAGTLAAVLPIYQDLGGSTIQPPSTISVFAIELGWPMTLFVLAIAVWLAATLYRGALNRGRDAFYPAAAAAATAVLIGEAFCDLSLLNACVAVFGDALIGLGLAQSVSGKGSF